VRIQARRGFCLGAKAGAAMGWCRFCHNLKNSGMKKKTLVLGCVILLLVLVVGSAVLWAIVPRVGYCFGTALSESEDHLFVSAGYRGLHTFYITPEGDLVHVSTTYDEGYYRYVEVMGDVVYVANSQRGLMVFDVSSGEPTPVWAQTGAKAYGIHLVPPLAFVAAEDQGLAIFDLSLHQEPSLGCLDGGQVCICRRC
jgi:hypothetical protein